MTLQFPQLPQTISTQSRLYRLMEKDNETLGILDSSDWFFEALLDGLAKKKPLEEYTGEEVKEITKEVLRGITPDMAESILETLKEGMPAKLKERRAEKAKFEEHIRRVWGKPLDLLEIFLELCLEAGMLFHEKMESRITSENKYLYQALLRLHARGCQIGAEVLTLLNSGFADGAHARWRTLYEITVVAHFICENGNDIAERYIRHDLIESYRAMNTYQKCYKRLGYDPCTEKEITEVTTAFKELCERFGPNFKEQYGWASEALHKKDSKFIDIENATNFNHMRAHYKLASHNVHAGPKGIVFNIEQDSFQWLVKHLSQFLVGVVPPIWERDTSLLLCGGNDRQTPARKERCRRLPQGLRAYQTRCWRLPYRQP